MTSNNTPGLQRSSTAVPAGPSRPADDSPPTRSNTTSAKPKLAKHNTTMSLDSDDSRKVKHKSMKRAKSMLKFVANPVGELDRKRTKREAKKLAKAQSVQEERANVEAFLRGGRDARAEAEAGPGAWAADARNPK